MYSLNSETNAIEIQSIVQRETIFTETIIKTFIQLKTKIWTINKKEKKISYFEILKIEFFFSSKQFHIIPKFLVTITIEEKLNFLCDSFYY